MNRVERWIATAPGRRMDHTDGVGNGETDCVDVDSDLTITCIPNGHYFPRNGIDCADYAGQEWPDYFGPAEAYDDNVTYPPGSIFSCTTNHTGVLVRPEAGKWLAVQQDTYADRASHAQGGPGVPAWIGPVNLTIAKVAPALPKLYESEDNMLTFIDTNDNQANLDVAAQPCDAVIPKATEGLDYINPYCDPHFQAAINSGKRTGVFHFAGDSTGKVLHDPVQEADYFLANIEGYIRKGVLALDFEPYTFGAMPADPDAWTDAFTSHIHDKTGVWPWVYMDYEHAVREGIDWSRTAKNCALWIAGTGHYGDRGTIGGQPWDNPPDSGQWTLVAWQYTDSPVDLDVAYVDGAGWDAYANPGNGPAPTAQAQAAAAAAGPVAVSWGADFYKQPGIIGQPTYRAAGGTPLHLTGNKVLGQKIRETEWWLEGSGHDYCPSDTVANINLADFHDTTRYFDTKAIVRALLNPGQVVKVSDDPADGNMTDDDVRLYKEARRGDSAPNTLTDGDVMSLDDAYSVLSDAIRLNCPPQSAIADIPNRYNPGLGIRAR